MLSSKKFHFPPNLVLAQTGSKPIFKILAANKSQDPAIKSITACNMRLMFLLVSLLREAGSVTLTSTSISQNRADKQAVSRADMPGTSYLRAAASRVSSPMKET